MLDPQDLQAVNPGCEWELCERWEAVLMLSRPSGKAILLLSFCMCLALALAQSQPALAFGPVGYHFTGSIGGKFAVQMELQIEGAKVSGRYWYETIGTPLELAGTFADGRVRLTERTADGKTTGTWTGAFNPLKSTWSGKWTSADGTKSFTFELVAAAEIVTTEEMRMGFIKVHVAHPVFTGAGKNRGLQDVQAFVDREVWAAAASIWSDPADPMSDDLEFEPDASWWSWEHFSEVTTRYYSSSLISMMNEVYHFTGGAHGMTFHTSMNLKVGKNGVTAFAIDQIFKKGTGWEKVVSDYVIRDLKARGADWVVSGEVREVPAKNMNRFTVSPAGIDLFFGPYEMGSYAQGTWVVLVPWSACKGLVDPNGPVAAIAGPAFGK